MPRQPTDDLQKVNLAPAARQVNTFVYGRRAEKTNTALQLAEALSGVSKITAQYADNERTKNLEQVEMDIQVATDNKLAGGNMFMDTYRENIQDYEEIKGTLRSPEEAAEYFATRNKKEFPDRHAQAGYDAKMRQKMNDFVEQHNNYVVQETVAERNVNIVKSFSNNVLDGNVEAAFSEMSDVVKNFNANPRATNPLVLSSVRGLLAQGHVDAAEEILKYNRGPAKSLIDNPETAETANQLMDKIEVVRQSKEDAKIRALKEQMETNELQQLVFQKDFKEKRLDDPTIPYDVKINEINRLDVLGQISDSFATDTRRYLKALQESQGSSDEALAGIIPRIYDINAISDRDPKGYLRGMAEIENDIIKLVADGKLDGPTEAAIKKQIEGLTSPKLAQAAQKMNRSFKAAKKTFEKNLPVTYQAEAIRQMFYATDTEEFEAALEGKTPQAIIQVYKQKANEVIDGINLQRREKTQAAIRDTAPITVADKSFLDTLGISMEEIEAEAAESGESPRRTIDTLIERKDSLQIKSPETDQILKDEGVVKDDNGNHITYKDSRGFLTGGHGHLMTEEEQAKYPEGTPIPQNVVDEWKETDLMEAKEDVKAIFGEVKHPEVEKVLKNMAFNLGRTKLNKFTRLKRAIENEDYKLAAQAMRESVWYNQVGDRSKRLVKRIENL